MLSIRLVISRKNAATIIPFCLKMKNKNVSYYIFFTEMEYEY